MDLIKVMIVEDEPLILKSFTNIINWENYGFKVAATALNGIIGMKQYNLYKPELILTDIKMPGISGLEMINEIKKINPNIRFIVISSYGEFEYAKKAINLGAEDYILKSELSEEYLGSKLTSFKEKHFLETDMRRDSLENRINKLFSSISTLSSDDIHSLFEPPYKRTILEYADYYYSLVLEILMKEYERLHISHLYNPEPIITRDDMEQHLQEELVKLKELSAACLANKYSSTVINAINYINKNFSNADMTINDIAENVNISISRLCVLFKKEVGQTINSYITDKRISEATRLLYLKNFKVYEVADMVGYKTSQYFSKIFYQKTGQYPNDYRNRIIRPENGNPV